MHSIHDVLLRMPEGFRRVTTIISVVAKPHLILMPSFRLKAKLFFLHGFFLGAFFLCHQKRPFHLWNLSSWQGIDSNCNL